MNSPSDTLQAAYSGNDKLKLEIVLSSIKDMFESHGRETIDLSPIVALLLQALTRESDEDVLTWTLEVLSSATFHSKFSEQSLGNLVTFLENNPTPTKFGWHSKHLA